MLKRIVFLIIILSFFFQFFAIPTSHAVPNEDIDHHLPVVYWQFDSRWGGEKHLNGNNTIGAVGCTLTSLTMLYIYHGSYYLPGSPRSVMYFLDPGKFNDWIVDNDAYTDGHDVEYYVVGGKFGYQPDFYTPSGGWVFTPYNQFVVPNHCCDDKCLFQSAQCFRVEKATDPTRFVDLLERDTKDYTPDIMKIKWRKSGGAWHEPHFVVVGGYDKANAEYRDYDPGKSYALPAQGFNSNMIYGAGNYELLGLRRFAKFYSVESTIDVSALDYTVHSPVEIQIIDPHGRRTGFDPATQTNLYENPMSDYYTEQLISSLYSDDPTGEPYKELKIIRPPEGNYILRIFGAGDGPYTINIKGRKNDGSVNLKTSLTGTATPSLLETYRVTYSPTGEASLSQTNQAPVANAGSDQTGEQSYEITLDGSASHDSDGDPMTYTWSFVSKPNGSGASLSDAHAMKPTFTPDLPGPYVVQLLVDDHFTNSAPSIVTITATPIKSRISVTPNYSQPLSAGSGFISFDINNIGRIAVTSGIIYISLADPTGTVLYTGSQLFSIGVGGNTSVSFPVTIPPLKLGNYTLTYTQSDETRTGTPTTTPVPNSSVVTFSFDKTIYRVRDTVNLTLNLINTGKFNLDGATVTVSVQDAGYTNSQSVSISPGQTLPLQYAIKIPSNIIAGLHYVITTLTLPSGSAILQSARFALQDSTLVLDIADSTQYAAGSLVTLTVENQGSVDTTYTTQKLTLTDNNGNVLYQGSVSDTIMAGEKKTLTNIQLPPQISGSMVLLAVTLKDVKTGKLSYLNKSLVINNGLQAGLLSRTDKDIYMNTEAVAAVSTIANSALNIEKGTLDIKVNRYKKPVGGTFTLFLPKSEGGGSDKGQFYSPLGIAVAPDGSVYVADALNNRIQKFDSNGNFVTMWGIYYPRGIAVAPDGSVYVTTSSHIIRKFDSKGNFVSQWGGYGNGNGRFYYPESIAVAPDGFVYVADTWNDRIQKFDSNGNFVAIWSNTYTYSYPSGIAVAPDGSVYVTNKKPYTSAL